VRLPAPVRSGLEAALATTAGDPDPIAGVSPIGGGCVSPTARVETSGGRRYFVKWGGAGLPAGILAAEAAGLQALASAAAVRVPGVLAQGGSGTGAWLLLEWLEPGPPGPATWPDLGRSLAGLHRRRARRFGEHPDNYIGSLPQDNASADDWADFWRDRRLAPQLEAATRAGLLGDDDRRRFDDLFRRLGPLLAPAGDDGASLLHGDLWRGNVHVLRDGTAALVDPSVYHGHREVDLAMADLFGGFPPAFRRAYQDAWPLLPAYEPGRRAAYQLYYLLVHVNLFGAGYVGGTRAALATALAAA
jgi:protein-ribulosamine 3-kinase